MSYSPLAYTYDYVYELRDEVRHACTATRDEQQQFFLRRQEKNEKKMNNCRSTDEVQVVVAVRSLLYYAPAQHRLLNRNECLIYRPNLKL